MTRKKIRGACRWALVLFGLICCSCSQAAGAQAKNGKAPAAKNVIFMVADGMGLGAVTAARLKQYGPGGERLAFEKLPVIGYQSTFAADSIITDSAAAASAWACGEKFASGEICFHANGEKGQPQSLLEIARSLGKGTGLVATSTITHATLAAFGAHVVSRKCETEIASQYIRTSRIDVLLGGGREKFAPSVADPCGNGDNILAAAAARGYTLVFSRPQLEAALPGAKRLLGLFAAGGLSAEHRRFPEIEEPRLPEMTRAALAVLEKNPAGFFLVVEGSQVDWGGHDQDLAFVVAEVLAFAEAVQTVRDWLARQPGREKETLLVVTADHGTGGLAITGPPMALPKPGEALEAGWASNNHTGTDTLIWAQGPGSEGLGRALDNTELYGVVRRSMRHAP